MTRLLYPATLALAATATVHAGSGFRVVDQDAAATARGNAFTATADNASAVLYNPAGVARLNGVQLRAGVYAVGLRSDFTAPDGRSSGNRREVIPAPQLYATWTPEGGPFSFGLGIYAPYGLALKYPDDAPFRTSALESRVSYVTVNPVVAFRVSPTLSVGVGATINYAEAELRQGVVTAGDEFALKGAGVAYGFNAGVLWQPVERHSFGVRYHSATAVDLSGHTAVRIPSFTVATPFGPFAVPAVDSEEDADGTLKFPQFVTFAYSYRPTPAWNLEIGAEWTDWNALNELSVDRGGAEKATVPFHWRSNWFYMAGVTRTWTSGWRASAGYIYAEKVVPEETFTAAVPDHDRHVFTLGAGWHGERWACDVAYEYSHQPERKIEQGTAADGRYQLDTHALSLSVGIRF